ncbi:sensor domain-containing diguanylate cyclase [Roseibium algae]|uniref:Diguanylate cyclase n=1 Tax=Roseibium algae TaxID=3123038 RepID=A0ABU8TPJ4_9HYPH
MGYIASQASNEQAIQNERRLFDNALKDKMRLFVREALPIARSDTSVEGLVLNFNYDFVRSRIGSLWRDHGHDRSMIVTGDGDILAESFREYTHISRRPITETPSLAPILKKARELYQKNRVRVPGGYSYRSLQGLQMSDYAAINFVVIDGKIALVGAMPIIPDKETVVLPKGEPTILISAQFIDEDFLKNLNSQLSFANLLFSTDRLLDDGGSDHLTQDIDGQTLGSFTWRSETQTDTIWPTVIPVIFVLSSALAILAFGIAWRIGKLTSSLQSSETQNRYLALHDTLSGLANRLQFNRVLETSIQNLPNKQFAVLHCDLDKFKAVNDSHGHAAGDAVIKAVAQRMKSVTGSSGLVARVGGDEFAIIMRTNLDRSGLTDLSNRLILSVSEPVPLPDDKKATVGLSIGISVAPEQGSDSETIVAAADAALYHSKQTGRGRMMFASDLKTLKKCKDVQTGFAREIAGRVNTSA